MQRTRLGEPPSFCAAQLGNLRAEGEAAPRRHIDGSDNRSLHHANDAQMNFMHHGHTSSVSRITVYRLCVERCAPEARNRLFLMHVMVDSPFTLC